MSIYLVYLNFTFIKVWKVDGNKLHDINTKDIDKIESIEWMDNDSKIMLWWKKYDYSSDYKPVDKKNWINECQVQVSR